MAESARRADDDGRHYYVYDKGLHVWVCIICGDVG